MRLSRRTLRLREHLVPKPEVFRCLWKDYCAEFKVRMANNFGNGHTHLTRLKLNTLPSKRLSTLLRRPDHGC